MDNAADRAYFRSQIRPFPRETHYPTGWNGGMTFAEICNSLTPNINRLMRYYRYVEVDIPDMVAHGFMRLWEELSKNPQFLAAFDQGEALAWLTYRSGVAHYRKFYRREMYLEDLATRSGDPDEFIIDGFDRQQSQGYAPFTFTVDRRLDIERAMRRMAEKYMDSREHLAALYYLTTSVTLDDAAALAERSGTKKCWWLTHVVKPMREELGDLLGREQHTKMTWQDKLRAGQEKPFLQLVERFAATDERMTVTLRGLAEHESVKSMMEKLDLPKSHVQYLRLRAYKELDQAYGCRSA